MGWRVVSVHPRLDLRAIYSLALAPRASVAYFQASTPDGQPDFASSHEISESKKTTFECALQPRSSVLLPIIVHPIIR